MSMGFQIFVVFCFFWSRCDGYLTEKFIQDFISIFKPVELVIVASENNIDAFLPIAISGRESSTIAFTVQSENVFSMTEYDPERATILVEGFSNLNDLRLDSNVIKFSLVGNGTRIILEEVHSIQKKPFLVQEVGTWNKNSGLVVPVKNKWDRRFNLASAVLSVVTEEFGPYLILPTDISKPFDKLGFIGEMFELLQEKTQFAANYRRSIDRRWGKVMPDGNVTGMLGMLYRQEVDIGTTVMSITPERAPCRYKHHFWHNIGKKLVLCCSDSSCGHLSQ